jgi:hypothetical protein
MNTLHFGTKAKNVKTVVNVNEVAKTDSPEQLDRANKMIEELKSKLQEYETKF